MGSTALEVHLCNEFYKLDSSEMSLKKTLKLLTIYTQNSITDI